MDICSSQHKLFSAIRRATSSRASARSCFWSIVQIARALRFFNVTGVLAQQNPPNFQIIGRNILTNLIEQAQQDLVLLCYISTQWLLRAVRLGEPVFKLEFVYFFEGFVQE